MLLDRIRAARTRWWLRQCERVGEHARLRGKPTVYATGGIHIGDRFRLSSRPTASHLVAGPDGQLVIGDDVAIGHGAAISAFERITIGDGTSIGPFVLIMDTNFHGSTGDQSVQHETRPVIVGKHCRIGSRVTITRGATIGDGAEILSGSVVSSSIPDGMCAGGARARVLGRAGDSTCRWHGPAVVLPELIQRTFALDALPGARMRPADLPWTDTRTAAFLAAIQDWYGIVIDAAVLRESTHVDDLVAAVEEARRRTGSAFRAQAS